MEVRAGAVFLPRGRSPRVKTEAPNRNSILMQKNQLVSRGRIVADRHTERWAFFRKAGKMGWIPKMTVGISRPPAQQAWFFLANISLSIINQFHSLEICPTIFHIECQRFEVRNLHHSSCVLIWCFCCVFDRFLPSFGRWARPWSLAVLLLPLLLLIWGEKGLPFF